MSANKQLGAQPGRSATDETNVAMVNSTAGSLATSQGGPSMKVKPLNDRVLIRRMEAEEKVKGGIIIPDTAKEKPLEGKVVAVGAGRIDENGKRIPMEVKVGDRVLIGKYSGTEVKIEDIEHVILKEDEILGVIA